MNPSVKKSAAKVAFETVVEEGALWFVWISDATKFEAMMKSKIPWADLTAAEKVMVQQRLKAPAPSVQMMVNSFYITMVAGFEEYLRGAIRELADVISHSKPAFDKMNEKLRRTNIRETARLLKRMDSPPDYLKFDESDLCRQLGTCVPGSAAVKLNGIALAEMDGLLKLTSFMERFEMMGKPITWDDLGRQQAVKVALRMEAQKPRAVGGQLEIELATIARYRNRIAHTGGHAADVTLQLADEHRAVLSAVATAIDLA